MSGNVIKIKSDETRLGIHAATQPVSGVKLVEPMTVHGSRHGAFIRSELAAKKIA